MLVNPKFHNRSEQEWDRIKQDCPDINWDKIKSSLEIETNSVENGIFYVSSHNFTLFDIEQRTKLIKFPSLGDLCYFEGEEFGSKSPYGVCDDDHQILLNYKDDLDNPERFFFITCVQVFKEKDSDWRWSKWGPYIGNHQPTTEYLRDEKDFLHVICYHIYEIAADMVQS